MESWAEFRTISFQASSSCRCGHSDGCWKSAASGSARRSSSRAACSPRRFTSTRFEVTPINMSARNPERSSPFQRSSPSVGAAGQVLRGGR